MAAVSGTSKSETWWPSVHTNTRPAPQRRVHVTGIVTGSDHSASGASSKTLLASTVL